MFGLHNTKKDPEAMASGSRLIQKSYPDSTLADTVNVW